MIFSILGSNKDKVFKKTKEIVDSMVKKRPGVSIFRMDDQSWKEEEFNELIGSQDIFVSKIIIVLKGVFLNEKAKDFILDNIEDLKNSQNAFVITEDKLNKESLSKLKNNSEKFFDFSSEKKNEKERFNIFSLTEALGNRDKKTAWIKYLKALESGMSSEEIYSMIWWQFKTILIAKRSPSQEMSGLKPFVFNKSLSMSKNFPHNDLEKFSGELINIYHSSRKGGATLDMAIEKFILTL